MRRHHCTARQRSIQLELAPLASQLPYVFELCQSGSEQAVSKAPKWPSIRYELTAMILSGTCLNQAKTASGRSLGPARQSGVQVGNRAGHNKYLTPSMLIISKFETTRISISSIGYLSIYIYIYIYVYMYMYMYMYIYIYIYIYMYIYIYI